MARADLSTILIDMVANEDSTLEFDKEHPPEVEIKDETFCIVAVRKDISLQGGHGAADCASRFYIDCFPKSAKKFDTDFQVWRAAAHIYFTGHGANNSATNVAVDNPWSKVIIDTDSLRKATAVNSSLLPCARKTSHVGNMSAGTIKARYEAYIDAINGRNMTQTLPIYCHDTVTHNRKPLPLSEYQQLMESAQAAIPDLEFRIAGTVVDFDRQMLAAKLDFLGTPTGEFAGVTPFEGAGKEVRFSEIVFYWLQDGKIAQVVSLVDLDAYRKQVHSRT